MRNYNAEKTAGKGNLALRMVEVKEARLGASTMELMLIAQIMVFCGLPYRRSTERRIVPKGENREGKYCHRDLPSHDGRRRHSFRK